MSRFANIGLQAVSEPSLTQEIGAGILRPIGWIGNVLDTPGSIVRGLLAGEAERAFSGILDFSDRVSGSELVYGPVGRDQFTWGGLGTEVALDPLNFFLPGATSAGKTAARASKLARTAKVAKTLGDDVIRADALTALRKLRNESFAQGTMKPGVKYGASLAEQAKLGQRSLLNLDIPFGPKIPLVRGDQAFKVLDSAGNLLSTSRWTAPVRIAYNKYLRSPLNARDPVLREANIQTDFKNKLAEAQYRQEKEQFTNDVAQLAEQVGMPVEKVHERIIKLLEGSRTKPIQGADPVELYAMKHQQAYADNLTTEMATGVPVKELDGELGYYYRLSTPEGRELLRGKEAKRIIKDATSKPLPGPFGFQRKRTATDVDLVELNDQLKKHFKVDHDFFNFDVGEVLAKRNFQSKLAVNTANYVQGVTKLLGQDAGDVSVAELLGRVQLGKSENPLVISTKLGQLPFKEVPRKERIKVLDDVARTIGFSGVRDISSLLRKETDRFRSISVPKTLSNVSVKGGDILKTQPDVDELLNFPFRPGLSQVVGGTAEYTIFGKMLDANTDAGKKLLAGVDLSKPLDDVTKKALAKRGFTAIKIGDDYLVLNPARVRLGTADEILARVPDDLKREVDALGTMTKVKTNRAVAKEFYNISKGLSEGGKKFLLTQRAKALDELFDLETRLEQYNVNGVISVGDEATVTQIIAEAEKVNDKIDQLNMALLENIAGAPIDKFKSIYDEGEIRDTLLSDATEDFDSSGNLFYADDPEVMNTVLYLDSFKQVTYPLEGYDKIHFTISAKSQDELDVPVIQSMLISGSVPPDEINKTLVKLLTDLKSIYGPINNIDAMGPNGVTPLDSLQVLPPGVGFEYARKIIDELKAKGLAPLPTGQTYLGKVQLGKLPPKSAFVPKTVDAQWGRYATDKEIEKALDKVGFTRKFIEKEVYQDALKMIRAAREPELLKGFLSSVSKINSFYRGALTSYWPAYHTRNLVSGAFMNSLAGVNGPTAYIEAFKQLADMPAEMVAKLEGLGVLHAGSYEETRRMLGQPAMKWLQNYSGINKKHISTKLLNESINPENLAITAEQVGKDVNWGEYFDFLQRSNLENYSAISPEHHAFNANISTMVAEDELLPHHADIIRYITSKMNNKLLAKINFEEMETDDWVNGTLGMASLRINPSESVNASPRPVIELAPTVTNLNQSNYYPSFYTFLHELGHVMHNQLFNQPERKEILRLSTKLGQKTKNYVPSNTNKSQLAYYKQKTEPVAEAFRASMLAKLPNSWALGMLHYSDVAALYTDVSALKHIFDNLGPTASQDFATLQTYFAKIFDPTLESWPSVKEMGYSSVQSLFDSFSKEAAIKLEAQKAFEFAKTVDPKKVFEPGLKFGQAVDNHIRMAHFLAMKKKGMTDFEAALSVKKYHFDYNDLTDFEKSVMRRVALFYTFTRKNIPLMMESYLSNPRFMQVYTRLIGETNVNIVQPNWLTDSFFLNTDDEGNQNRLSWGLPPDDISRFSPDGQGLPRFLELLISNSTPLIRMPYEFASQRDSFFGRPQEGGRFERLLRSLPSSRLTGTYTRIVDNPAKEIPRALTGAAVRSVPPWQDKLNQVDNIRNRLGELTKQGRAKTYPITVNRFGQSDPEVNELNRLMSKIQSQISEQKK